jgi:uncharacterized protein (DUF1501 family)
MASDVDAGMAALLADLADRGLLADTLVVAMGEFGRTPAINKQAGREHYSKAWSIMVAGGGVKGGQVVGRTDRTGAAVLNRPIAVVDFMATVYQILGIDYNKQFMSPGNRPIPIVDNQNHRPQPIRELFG